MLFRSYWVSEIFKNFRVGSNDFNIPVSANKSHYTHTHTHTHMAQ